MDIALLGYYYRLKRYWKRRRYERLGDENATRTTSKRKIKIAGLRSQKRSNLIKIKRAPKLKFMLILPLKLVAKFHQAYVALAGEQKLIENPKEKKVRKSRPVHMVLSANTDATVDLRRVMELYGSMVSQRELSTISSD